MLFLISIFLIKTISSLPIIVFPLEREDYKFTDPNDYYKYLTRAIVSKIKVGTPEQEIDLTILFREHPFFLKSYSSSGKYNKDKSSSFKNLSEEFECIRQTLLTDAILSTEDFNFKDTKGNNNHNKNVTFILATQFNSKTSKPLNACLGLTLIDKSQDMHFNIIHELKYEKKINSSAFSINYLNNDKGEIVIGALPNEYNNNYDYNNYRTTPAETTDRSILWKTPFDSLKLNDQVISNEIIGIFDLNFEGFRMPPKILDNFNELFFNEYYKDNKCTKNQTKEESLTYIMCDNSISLSKFPNVHFEHKTLNYTFQFSSKELFINLNNKLYFAILFHSFSKDYILGEIFLKKYQMVFDQEKRVIGFYGENLSKSNVILKIVFLIFMTVVVMVLGYFLYIFLIKKSRKKRAYELEDDYDYLPSKI